MGGDPSTPPHSRLAEGPGATKQGLGSPRRARLGAPREQRKPQGGPTAAGRTRGSAGWGRKAGMGPRPPSTVTTHTSPSLPAGARRRAAGEPSREPGARRAPLSPVTIGARPRSPSADKKPGGRAGRQRPAAARLRSGLAPLRAPPPSIWPHRRLRWSARRSGGPVRCRYSRAER